MVSGGLGWFRVVSGFITNDGACYYRPNRAFV